MSNSRTFQGLYELGFTTYNYFIKKAAKLPGTLYLFYCHTYFLFQRSSWQPRFLVLYSGSSDTHPHIELYDNQDKFNETKEASKKCDKKIDLNRVKFINKSTQKSSSGVDHIIEIHCKKDKHVFSVNNEYEFNDWDYRLSRVVSVLPEKGGESSSHTDPGDGEEVVTANLMYEQTSEGMSMFIDFKEKIHVHEVSCALPFLNTGLPHHNATFGVHRKRLLY